MHVWITGGAESGAVRVELSPDLAKIVAAWPNLPEAIKRPMLAMIGSAGRSPIAVSRKRGPWRAAVLAWTLGSRAWSVVPLDPAD